MKQLELVIASEFSRTPGPRRSSEGKFSGESFLERVLLPKFKEAQGAGISLLVDLDGTAGYATSFLEAAFGGLARRFGAIEVRKTIALKSDDEPYLRAEIMKYIDEA